MEEESPPSASLTDSRSPLFQQICQCIVLMKKNLWLYCKDWKTTGLALLAPFAFMFLLYILQNIYVHEMSKIGAFPEAEPLDRIPRCQAWGGQSCWTLLYAVEEVNNTLKATATSYHDSYMPRYVNISRMGCPADFHTIEACENAPDEFDTTRRRSETGTNSTMADLIVRQMAQRNTPALRSGYSLLGFDGDYFSVPSRGLLMDFLADHPNQTQNALLFHTYQGDVLGYTVLHNTTYSSDNLIASLIRGVDEVLHSMDPGTTTDLNSHISTMGFPKSKPRFLSNSIIQMAGPVFFFCPPMLIFIVTLNQIVREKELKLRQGMNIMGLTDSMFWISWLLTAQIMNAVAALFIVIAGFVAQFEFFTQVPFMITFLTFFLFSSAMVPVTFLCSTLVSTTKQASLLGFFVFLSGLFLQLIFTNVAIYYWYSPDSPHIWVFLFNFYPPFNFAKCCADYILKAYPAYSFDANSFSTGTRFYWSDLVDDVYVPLIDITVQPTIWSFYYLLFNMGFYAIVAWYLDNVLPSVNGASRPFYYPVTPSYWGISVYAKGVSDEERAASFALPSSWQEMDNLGASASLLHLNDEDAEPPGTSPSSLPAHQETLGLDIRNLVKVYKRSWWPTSKSDKRAVSDLNLRIEKGTIFCMLGHNGAGKTTLINMLTGVHLPTSGTAKIFGYDIVRERDQIRAIMGVCPQHDILWEDLTAWQHLEIFAELKGVPSAARKQVIVQKLEEVELLSVARNQVRTYSGGMKRRLSVAISSISDPQIMFFDEPTTGLDPVSKRSVWRLIKNLRKDRVIILTTHSMDEAEYLADTIGVMSQGMLMVSGPSLELRARFGNGYKLSLITRSNSCRIQDLVAEQLPDATLVASNAGSVTYTVPHSTLSRLSPFFKSVRDDPALTEYLVDWGIAHSSLEEVFHNVTQMGEEEGKLALTGELLNPLTLANEPDAEDLEIQ